MSARIGLGLAALGRPGYITLGHADDLQRGYSRPEMERHAHEVLDAAWAGGVRHFDAARSYGDAERFLAGWLESRRIAPRSVTVSSKWGYVYTAGWQVEAERHEMKDHSLPVLQRQWQETWDVLGSYVSIYQIHSATIDSCVLEDSEVLAELARLSRSGITIGLSLSGPAQAAALRQALAIDAGGQPLFGAVQATWNILEPSCGPALADAHARGWLVIVKEALANGRLTTRNTAAACEPPMSVLRRESSRLGTTIDALAMAAALAQPWAGIVLSGAARADHLGSNLRARDVAWDGEAAASLAALAEDASAYWARRSRLAWN
jgi:aryl-alcohol dehydrogenase-like predicted oxidoreductase